MDPSMNNIIERSNSKYLNALSIPVALDIVSPELWQKLITDHKTQTFTTEDAVKNRPKGEELLTLPWDRQTTSKSFLYSLMQTINSVLNAECKYLPQFLLSSSGHGDIPSHIHSASIACPLRVWVEDPRAATSNLIITELAPIYALVPTPTFKFPIAIQLRYNTSRPASHLRRTLGILLQQLAGTRALQPDTFEPFTSDTLHLSSCGNNPENLALKKPLDKLFDTRRTLQLKLRLAATPAKMDAAPPVEKTFLVFDVLLTSRVGSCFLRLILRPYDLFARMRDLLVAIARRKASGGEKDCGVFLYGPEDPEAVPAEMLVGVKGTWVEGVEFQHEVKILADRNERVARLWALGGTVIVKMLEEEVADLEKKQSEREAKWQQEEMEAFMQGLNAMKEGGGKDGKN